MAVVMGEGQDWTDIVCELVLFVEGNDEARFFETLMKPRAVQRDVQILPVGGKDQMAAKLHAAFKSRAFVLGSVKGYGIVHDADLDPAAAIRRVHQILRENNQPTPAHGSFVAANGPAGPKAGLFIVPSNNATGDLDELCFSTVAMSERGRLVQEFIGNVETEFGELDKKSKRFVQSYLAAKDGHLCRGAGFGFSRGHFEPDHIALDPIKAFLDKLFA